MDTLLQDLRYALRTLSRSRGFAAAAILSLALGIGVNTAVFSVVNTFLIRPLPMAEPERVVMLHTEQHRQGIEDAAFSVADLEDVRAQSSTLEEVAAVARGGFNLAGGDEPERVQGAWVTRNLFGLTGVQPVLGRGFLPQEDRPGGEPVVILGHGLWQRRFGGRADVVGRTVLVSGSERVVVGVMPPGYKFPEVEELWVPLQGDPAEARSERYLLAVGRLRPGATLEAARAELAAIGRRAEAASPATNAGWSFDAKSWRDEWVDAELRLSLFLMAGAVGFVLLIACANVANLLLARAAGRRREIAVRAALGAGRRRIVRQLLTESLLVALAGGVLGTLVATWWLDWTTSRIPEELAYWIVFRLDGTVLAFTLGLSVLTGLVFGTLPALRASRADLSGGLKDGARGGEGGPGRSRLRGALVAGEVALALVLLVGAGLMVRSFRAAVRADVGFATEGMLVMRTSLSGERYAGTPARVAAFEQIAERVRALPGVRSAAWSIAVPGTDQDGVGSTLVADGRPTAPGEGTAVRTVASLAGLFRTLEVPLVAGRDFTPQEAGDTAASVVVLGRSLAERLWPGEDPLGRRVRLAIGDTEMPLTVVGVAPDLYYGEPGDMDPGARFQVHLPYGRAGWGMLSLLVRSERDPAALAPAVRGAVRAVDPALPVWDVRTMREEQAYATWFRRLMSEVFGSFGGLALALAALGVYGVVAYGVAQRTREFGIRLALGAESRDLVRMVVRRGVALAATGVGLGLLGALGVSRLMRGVLYGVEPGDPGTFAAVALLLLGVALLASWLPARRATRVDPMTALRSE
ncbi:MAG TPA: ABC transporter permease [Longimicrobiaceae bacterium]|nr:ABC transporter permease [Longimicrobiaceae bacterium]